MKSQYQILREMQTKGYNVCTCGNCGDVVLFDKQMSQQNDIECPHCDIIMDQCHYPDLYSQSFNHQPKDAEERHWNNLASHNERFSGDDY